MNTQVHCLRCPKSTLINADAFPLVTQALKGLARDAKLRETFHKSTLLQQTLAAPASRYVAPDRCALKRRITELIQSGYSVGTELVGENTSTPAEVAQIEAEYLALIADLARLPQPRPTLNFDLSNLGLAIDPKLAERSLRHIAEKAAAHSITVMLSMEGADLVDAILKIFYAVQADIPTLGITVQAFRQRTDRDLDGLLRAGARLRLVKGVYDEPKDTIIPRGAELNRRYAEQARRIIEAGGTLQLATHDKSLIAEIINGNTPAHVEIEMLHGVCPDLATTLRQQGLSVRIYCTYGQDFWLHFMHRLAEAPENLFTAFADLADPARLKRKTYT